MSRVIKFRAWDSNAKLMSFFDLFDGDENGMGTWRYQKGALGKMGMYHERYFSAHNKEMKVMQFTGLTDKNGKKIYEGDVVRILYTDWASQGADDSRSLQEYKESISDIGFVEFDWDRWVLNFGEDRFGSDRIGSLREGKHGEKEVIGNIYENPDLLTS